MEDLSNKMNNWNLLDTEILKINNYLKILKKNKSDTETDILNILKNNNLTQKKIRFNDKHFTYNISKTLPPLTLTLLETILNDTINNEAKNIILEKIKNYRENNKSESITLKRKKIKKTKCNSLKK